VLRKWLALVALGSVFFVGVAMAVSALTAHPAVRPIRQPGPLVLVGMPALAWKDVSPTRTPALWGLAERGAVADQATMVLGGHSCPNQSWLTLSAGTPTVTGHPPRPGTEPTRPTTTHARTCAGPLAPQPGLDSTAVFGQWETWRRYGHTRGAPVDIGRIASAMAASGQCIAAYGDPAGLAAANRLGIVDHYSAGVDRVNLRACPVTFISLPGPDDRYLAHLLHRLPADATIVVSGMADGTGPTTLHTLVAAGPGVPHGLLTSLSTRQPGFVQTSDLSALVVDRLGASAPNLPDGRSPVVRPVSGATTAIGQVTGLARALEVEHPFVPVFFGVFLGGAVLAAVAGLVCWWVARRRQRARGEPTVIPEALRWWFAVVGAMTAATPVSTFLVGLVPWWQPGHPLVALSAGIFVLAVAITAVALLGPWRRWRAGPMTFLMALTLFVIAQDVVHGSRLQFISLMGLQPVYGGRYFGQGNVGYALYATSALLLAAVLAGRLVDGGHRRLAALTVAIIGLGAVVIDGFPSWGADGGGPIALLPAVAYLALNAAGLSLTWRRIVVIAGSTVVVVGGFAVLDYLRPPRYRTHLGDFVATLRNTGQLSGLQRIWTENWAMLTANWLNMSVGLLLLATMLVLVMPRLLGRPLQPLMTEVTFLGNGLSAMAVCWLLGFLANDSGTSIPPTGLLLVAPLLVVLAACTRRDRSGVLVDAGRDPKVTPLRRNRAAVS
jgi:hypothetical protein